MQLKFTKYDRTFNATFTVMSHCVHDFILGGPFLRETRTLTTFKRRIHRSLIKAPVFLRVCLNRNTHEKIVGSVDGHTVEACPDTGSDVNVIQLALATALGLTVSANHDNTTLEFVDGSLTEACGIVRNAMWRFGHRSETQQLIGITSPVEIAVPQSEEWKHGTNATQSHTFICDFHVVEDLSIPVILSSNLLYGTNAFTACAKLIQRTGGQMTLVQPVRSNVAVVRKVFVSPWERLSRKNLKRKRETVSCERAFPT